MRQRGNIRRALCCLQQLACFTAFTVLQACHHGGPDAPFQAYLKARSSALSIRTPTMNATRLPQLPNEGAWQLEIAASGIDGLDMLQVSGCAVQANISKRQTSLGQFAKPSQYLFLELEYLRAAPACISRLRNSNDVALAEILQIAWHEKQGQLPAVIFNATLGSDEYRSFWLALPAPGDYPRSSPETVASALHAINEQTRRWLNGDYRARNRSVELLLSDVAGGDGGLRLQHWCRQIDWITATNLMMEQALAKSPSSLEYHRNTLALHRAATAHSYFADVIQPLTTQSQHRLQEVLVPITALETQLSAALPTLYQDWIIDRNQRIAALTNASGRHLALLRHQQNRPTE